MLGNRPKYDFGSSLDLPRLISEMSLFTRVLLLGSLSLLLWRLWKFTLSPLLQPGAPKQLPYWIPFFGHGFGFFQNANAILERASKHFSNRDPFAITVFGSVLYITTQPEHTIEIFKNTESLSFEVFVKTLMRANGMSDSGVEAAYTPLPKTKAGFPNPHGEALGVLVRQINIHQLYPGGKLDTIDSRMLSFFERHLHMSIMRDMHSQHTVSGSKAVVRVPLMKWCSELLVKAAGFSYFGETLDLINPNLAQTFLAFDELGWQVLYQYPAFLTSELSAVRQGLIRTFKTYFQTPKSQREDEVWSVGTLENELRSLGIGDDDIAALFLNVYWGINTNTYKAVFWMLLNLLQNPSLIDVIRGETAGAFEGDDLIDLGYLVHKCPQTSAVWNETLRHCSNAASVRIVTEDIVIGGKTLKKGHRVMIPYRSLHFDATVFGNDVHSFRPERFADTNKKLTRGPSWRPFGGGTTMCTGRYAAEHATLMFVALVLRRFNIAVAGDSTLAEPDIGRPIQGLMSVKGDGDMVVEMSRRTIEI